MKFIAGGVFLLSILIAYWFLVDAEEPEEQQANGSKSDTEDQQANGDKQVGATDFGRCFSSTQCGSVVCSKYDKSACTSAAEGCYWSASGHENLDTCQGGGWGGTGKSDVPQGSCASCEDIFPQNCESCEWSRCRVKHGCGH